MFSTLKISFFYPLLLVFSLLVFFSSSSADDGSVAYGSEVYLADEPLPKIAAKLKSQGMQENEIIGFLKKTLPRITPKLAYDRLGAIWGDDGFQGPALALCFMGEGVGYGLFAMENIKSGKLIAPYLDNQCPQNCSFNAPMPNLLNTCLNKNSDCQQDQKMLRRNAASYAQHLLSKNELSSYEYTLQNGMLDVVVANSKVSDVLIFGELHKFLSALKEIKSFEQIGFSYSPLCGYAVSILSHDMHFLAEPYLFDKDGNLILKSKYQTSKAGVMLFDKESGKRNLLAPMRREAIERLRTELPRVSGYILIPLHDDEVFVTDDKKWDEAFLIPNLSSRLTLVGHFLSGSEGSIIESVKKMSSERDPQPGMSHPVQP